MIGDLQRFAYDFGLLYHEAMRLAMPPISLKQAALYLAFVSLFGALIFFATYRLTESPPVWYDEGIYTQNALNVFLRGASQTQVAPETYESAWSTSGGFSFIGPISISYALFGPSVLSGRAVMAIFIVLSALGAVALLYRLWGIRAALLGLAMLVTFPVLYGQGKNVIGEVPGLMYLLFFLCTVAHIEKKKFDVSIAVYGAAGLLAGLCAVTKPLYLALPAAAALVLLWRYKAIPWQMSAILAVLLGGLLPLGIHLVLHLQGASLATIVAHYANPYDIGGSSLVVTIGSNIARFVTEVSPAYCALLVGAWGLTAAWRLYRGIEVSLAERIALVFTILILLAYVRTVGWYRYFFAANVLAVIFLPGALLQLGWRKVAYGVVAILIGIQVYQLFFTSWVSEHYDNTKTAQLENYFAGIPQEKSIAFMNVPELVLFGYKHPYYQYLPEAPAIVRGAHVPSVVGGGVPDIVAIRGADHELYAPYLKNYSLQDDFAGYNFFTR